MPWLRLEAVAHSWRLGVAFSWSPGLLRARRGCRLGEIPVNDARTSSKDDREIPGQFYPTRASFIESGRARRVLLVANGDRLRHVHARSLERHGHAVHATSGDEAQAVLSAIVRGRLPLPDIVVKDVPAPLHAELRVLRAMRRAEWTMPVIVLTTRLDRRLRAVMVDFDVFACLTKPVSPALLGRAVEDALLDSQST